MWRVFRNRGHLVSAGTTLRMTPRGIISTGGSHTRDTRRTWDAADEFIAAKEATARDPFAGTADNTADWKSRGVAPSLRYLGYFPVVASSGIFAFIPARAGTVTFTTN